MKIFEALRIGGKQIITHWRMWGIFYASNLAFALVVAIPFRNWLSNAAGHTGALEKGIGQFNFTVIMDILRNNAGFSLLYSQASVIAVVYLIFSAFLVGGALCMYVHHREKFATKEFLAGGATYFWRMLRLAVYFLFIHCVVLAILFGVVTMLGLNPKEIESDVQYMQTLKILLAVYLFLAMVIAIVHDYVKIHIVRKSIPMRKAFNSGMRFVIRHFGSVLCLYVINLLLLLGLYALYFILRKSMPSISTGGIFLGFLLSQVFLVTRIGVKLLTLSSANALIQLKQAQEI